MNKNIGAEGGKQAVAARCSGAAFPKTAFSPIGKTFRVFKLRVERLSPTGRGGILLNRLECYY